MDIPKPDPTKSKRYAKFKTKEEQKAFKIGFHEGCLYTLGTEVERLTLFEEKMKEVYSDIYGEKFDAQEFIEREILTTKLAKLDKGTIKQLIKRMATIERRNNETYQDYIDRLILNIDVS